ncbi:dihydrodipicolinate synthetase (plasmid) [Haloterrigena turkmenica DSM 5511]|uniref:Dihydrodipicolinate synthetase n=1 Tax=Haloterrigena turkmenica (strain ATCC 51198 / DSM 5511 / JCM 9101 / NCIMB 13204 / VKM B-1734 / 4k) TaxID=543526 RepID=D2S0Y4_HALTV|nr:dihydrodipicolinate synthase family protein [Haloterrigena turkmenica]ADB63031.1 dihydrodipicolinate synthetase [Haloterrigena turkmenica DSM 5511]
MSLATAEVKERLRGVAVGILTPFDQDGEIEHWKIEENAQSLYDEGIRTFLAAANISEYHSLADQERIDVTEAAVTSLPSDACVLAGVGGSTNQAQDLIRAYDQIGVDAMMVMPPDHTYLHEQGLLEYYRSLADATETPLVPYVRGFDPSVEYLAQLTKLDGVVGIKYALTDSVKLGAGISAGADDVVWVNGLAEPYAVSYWAEGVEGFSAGVSNFRPEIGLELYDALANENWSRARELRDVSLPYQSFREKTGQNNTIAGGVSVPAVKKGLELAGLYGGDVREPIRSLTPQEEKRAEELYDQLNDKLEQLLSNDTVEKA